MAETTKARRKLIIKLYSSRSETHEVLKANTKDSSTVSKVCALKNKKGYYAAAIWVNVENPTKSSGAANSVTLRTKNPSKSNGVDSRESRRESKECKLNSKREQKKQHPMIMDSRRKKQCWTMLKRLMVGRDSWALKQPLLHYNNQAMTKPKLKTLEDIESKLMKLGYSEVDEFSHDVKLVFSYALGYPPKGEVHRTARRISEGFEVSWKKLKEEWMHEEKDKRKKI